MPLVFVPQLMWLSPTTTSMSQDITIMADWVLKTNFLPSEKYASRCSSSSLCNGKKDTSQPMEWKRTQANPWNGKKDTSQPMYEMKKRTQTSPRNGKEDTSQPMEWKRTQANPWNGKKDTSQPKEKKDTGQPKERKKRTSQPKEWKKGHKPAQGIQKRIQANPRKGQKTTQGTVWCGGMPGVSGIMLAWQHIMCTSSVEH